MLLPARFRRSRRPTRRLLAPALAVCLAAACGGADERLLEVRTLLESGRYGDAIEVLRPVLAEHPDHAEANHLLGISYAVTGHPRLAVGPLEKAARSEQYAIPAGLLLASARLQAQDLDGAVEAASRVLEHDPSRIAALYTRGQAHLAARRAPDALADADRILELVADDGNGLLLRGAALCTLERWDDCESAYRRLREVSADAPAAVAARACLALASFYRDWRHDLGAARKTVEECVTAQPTEPMLLSWAAPFLDGLGDPERAEAIWRGAVASNPDDLTLRAGLAQRLLETGQADAAERLLEQAVERTPSGVAWGLLLDLQRRRGALDAALATSASALETLSGAEAEALRFARAGLLVEAGQLDAAAALGETLASPAHRAYVRARILLERGEEPAAVEAFEEAVRVEPAATDAALFLARRYLARGHYGKAIGMARRYAAARPFAGVEARLLVARAAAAGGDVVSARRVLDQLAATQPLGARGVVERAWIERRTGGAAAAVRVVEQSGLDLAEPANAAVLELLVGDLLALGRAEEALGRVRAALARRADAAGLHALEGSTLLALGRVDAARQAFEQALARQPELGAALAGLGEIAAASGRVEEALARYDAASEADPSSTMPAYRAAQLLLASARPDGAEARLREIVRRDPANAFACNDLAYLLAEQQRDLALAEELAARAVRLAPSAETLDTRGFVALQAGEPEAAIETLQQALARNPELAGGWYHLGLAQARSGDPAAAAASWERALGIGSAPWAEQAREALARLEPRPGS